MTVPPFILVFSHSKSLLTLWRVNLQARHYRVVGHLQDFAMVDLVTEIRPDLLILEYTVGNVDAALEIVRAVKAHRSTRDTPALLFTAGFYDKIDIEALAGLKAVQLAGQLIITPAVFAQIQSMLDDASAVD